MIAVLLALVSRTQADNLTIGNVTMSAGETKQMGIALENPSHRYSAFQFDLILPEGISIAKDGSGQLMAGLDESRKEDHTLEVTDKGAGAYRFLSYSMSSAEFKGSNGNLVNITLKASGDISKGARTATVKSQVFTETDGELYKWAALSFLVTIKPAIIPVITAEDKTREYGEENPELTYTVSDEITGKPELTTTAVKTSPVGVYEIVVGQGTVEDEFTPNNGQLTVTKAVLTIIGGTYTMKQGEPLPNFAAAYSGFKNGETEAVLAKKPILATTATSASEPGTYEITVSGAEAQNYDIKYEAGSLTITEADPVTVTAKDYTRVYGDDNPAFEFSTEGAELKGKPEISCEATAASPVGTYPIVIKKGGVTNYNDTYVNGTLTITKAPLTIKAGTYVRKQGEENPEFTLTYEGFKNGETEAVLTKQPTVTTTATKESAVGDYEVKVSGAEAQNYEISYSDGTLKVTDADAVVVTAKSYTREYGEANPTFEYEVSGVALEGQPEISCEATATSPVGTYPIVIKKGGVTNYNDTYINGTLTITKAPLTIKAGTYTKKKGEKDPEFTLTYEGFKNDETEAVLTAMPTVNCEAIENSPAGDYEVKVYGAEAQNYDITYVNGVLTVEQLPTSAGLTFEPFAVDKGGEVEVFIDLSNPDNEITWVQFELILPAGLTVKMKDGEYAVDIAGRTTWEKHILKVTLIDGIIRFILSSESNAILIGNEGAIIKLTLVADDNYNGGTVKIENIVMKTPDDQTLAPEDVVVVGVTDVTAAKKTSDIYTLSGQKLAKPRKGINIIGGKKVVVK